MSLKPKKLICLKKIENLAGRRLLRKSMLVTILSEIKKNNKIFSLIYTTYILVKLVATEAKKKFNH